MLQSHDQSIISAGGYGEAGRQAFLFDNERVVACCLKAFGQSFEDAFAAMDNGRYFTVHQMGCAHNLAAICLTDGLEAETDTKNGDFTVVALDKFKADACFIGRAGAGGKHDGFCFGFQDLIDRDLVVSNDLAFGTKFAEIVNQIIGEAVVIIDECKHGGVKECSDARVKFHGPNQLICCVVRLVRYPISIFATLLVSQPIWRRDC